jgi:hypothetical protein
MRTATVRGLTGALALGAALVLAGCGGDDSGSHAASVPTATTTFAASPLPATKPSPGPRPSSAQLSRAIQKSKNSISKKSYTATQARCIAAALLATDLSDGSLNALAANIGTYVPPKAESKIFQTLIPEIVSCSK